MFNYLFRLFVRDLRLVRACHLFLQISKWSLSVRLSVQKQCQPCEAQLRQILKQFFMTFILNIQGRGSGEGRPLRSCQIGPNFAESDKFARAYSNEQVKKVSKDLEDCPKFWCDLGPKFLSSALSTWKSLAKTKIRGTDAIFDLFFKMIIGIRSFLFLILQSSIENWFSRHWNKFQPYSWS